YAQQRLWLLDQIDGGSAHYNMPGGVRLTGHLQVAALNQALNTILERHESLRTHFVAGEDGQPLQVIKAAEAVTVAVVDLSTLSEAEQQAQVVEHAAAEASRVFDLSGDL